MTTTPLSPQKKLLFEAFLIPGQSLILTQCHPHTHGQVTVPTARRCLWPMERWCVWTRVDSQPWSSTTDGCLLKTPSAAKTASTPGKLPSLQYLLLCIHFLPSVPQTHYEFHLFVSSLHKASYLWYWQEFMMLHCGLSVLRGQIEAWGSRLLIWASHLIYIQCWGTTQYQLINIQVCLLLLFVRPSLL